MSKDKRVNAGYEIIDSSVVGNVEVVIGHDAQQCEPYVCWFCKDHKDYYWGYYCSTHEKACEKFIDRLFSEAASDHLERKYFVTCFYDDGTVMSRVTDEAPGSEVVTSCGTHDQYIDNLDDFDSLEHYLAESFEDMPREVIEELKEGGWVDMSRYC